MGSICSMAVIILSDMLKHIFAQIARRLHIEYVSLTVLRRAAEEKDAEPVSLLTTGVQPLISVCSFVSDESW